MKFSIVVPVKDEIDLILKTLPSYYSVGASEVIICTDKPTPEKVCQSVQRVAATYDATRITKIIEVERDPEWSFHQAHVRRVGFKEARYDRILTTDIDLVVNRNVLKALRLVGKNNVGLVSCSKFRYPKSLADIWRVGTLTFLRMFVHGTLDRFLDVSLFTGLYAFWRPYWLDSEPEEKIRKHVNPKQFYRSEFEGKVPSDVNPTGEDTHLRDCMLEKHRCIYLSDIGAVMLREVYEDVPYVQFMKGRYFRRRGRSLIVSVGRAFLRAQPYYLAGYLLAGQDGRRVGSASTKYLGKMV